MKVESFVLNLTTDDPELLRSFYDDILELPHRDGMGEGAFALGDATLIIDGHSLTRGQALEAEQQRLEARGVEFIRRSGREWWGGIISTFLDPDGNYCQLVEYRPD
jgi:catechol 2,3-dioxygenase-like lactoylglutathione lyase family enzyme